MDPDTGSCRQRKVLAPPAEIDNRKEGKETGNQKEASKDPTQEEREPMRFNDRTQHTIADTHTNTDTNGAKWQPTEMFRSWAP